MCSPYRSIRLGAGGALPDPFAIAILAATLIALGGLHGSGVFKLMIAGAAPRRAEKLSSCPVEDSEQATRLFIT